MQTCAFHTPRGWLGSLQRVKQKPRGDFPGFCRVWERKVEVLRASKSVPFTVEIRRAFPDALVVLAGEFDASNVAELYEQFSDLLREGIQRISLQLAEVTYMDSTGLSVLVAVQKRTRALAGELVIISPNPRIRRLFAVTSLDSYFTVRPVDDPSPGYAPAAPLAQREAEEPPRAAATRLAAGN